MIQPSMTLRGIDIFQELLDAQAQAALVEALREVIRAAPFFAPVTARGKAMSVRMTSGAASRRDCLAGDPGGCPWLVGQAGQRDAGS